MAVTWVTPVDITTGTTGAWTDVDLDTFIGSLPADVSGVIIRCYNNGASTTNIGVRKNGSTDNRISTLRHHGLQGMMIGVDADNILEMYIGNADIEMFAVGYMQDADAGWLTNGTQKSPTSGSWQDIDISSDTGGDTAIAAVFEWINNAAYGQRQNGSTDNRIQDPQNHMWSMAGCDGSEITEVYRGGSDPFLIGWFLQDFTALTNATDHSLGSTGSWINITTGAGAGVCMECNGSGDFGLRNDGSAEDITGHCGGNDHCWSFIESTSQIVEGNISATAVDFFEVGTFDAAAAGGGTILPYMMSYT